MELYSVIGWLINVGIGAAVISSLLPNIGWWTFVGLIWMWSILVGIAYRN